MDSTAASTHQRPLQAPPEVEEPPRRAPHRALHGQPGQRAQADDDPVQRVGRRAGIDPRAPRAPATWSTTGTRGPRWPPAAAARAARPGHPGRRARPAPRPTTPTGVARPASPGTTPRIDRRPAVAQRDPRRGVEQARIVLRADQHGAGQAGHALGPLGVAAEPEERLGRPRRQRPPQVDLGHERAGTEVGGDRSAGRAPRPSTTQTSLASPLLCVTIGTAGSSTRPRPPGRTVTVAPSTTACTRRTIVPGHDGAVPQHRRGREVDLLLGHEP